MTNPPIPVFPNPEKHVSKKELAKEIRQTLLNLANKMVGPENRNTVIRFVGCIHPDSRKDPGRLPYDKEKARHENHIECLSALICKLLHVYWSFCEDGIGVETIKGYIGKIQHITQQGLKAYKIEGDDKDGYQLA